jgi:hypothetical protein
MSVTADVFCPMCGARLFLTGAVSGVKVGYSTPTSTRVWVDVEIPGAVHECHQPPNPNEDSTRGDG